MLHNVSQFSECFGCGVCAAACPKNAIAYKVADAGFYRPSVDEAKCVDCGLCMRVCSYSDHGIARKENSETGFYSAWSNDEQTRRLASSGGVVQELAQACMKAGYSFCAARYDHTDNRVKHTIIDDAADLRSCTGSNYIQSDFVTDGIGKLQASQKYLVIGTPCQIDSLRRLIRLQKREDDFILVDFFCHGVPSIRMWDKYLSYTRKTGFQEVRFRDKREGWHEASYRIVLAKEGERLWESKLTDGDLFYQFFLRDRCLNAACYGPCKFKTVHSAADIRVGDMWGRKFSGDRQGVNVVITFSEKGEKVFKGLKTCTIHVEDKEQALDGQMTCNAKRPPSYPYVYKALHTSKSLPRIQRGALLREFPGRVKSRLVAYTQILKRHFVK